MVNLLINDCQHMQKGHVVTNMPLIFSRFYTLPTTQSGSHASATARSMLKYLLKPSLSYNLVSKIVIKLLIAITTG